MGRTQFPIFKFNQGQTWHTAFSSDTHLRHSSVVPAFPIFLKCQGAAWHLLPGQNVAKTPE